MFFENLGFDNHPFAKTNADEEPRLNEYFVPPPYFDAIVGDSQSPSASVVLAPRGAGKTAQRRMVESHAIKSQFLAVTYDRFEFGAGEKLKDITLQYHLRNIITRILISFLSYASENKDVIRNLSKEERRQMSVFVQSYLGNIKGDELQELMKELKSLPERFKTFWKENVGFMESTLNFLLKSYDLETIDLPDAKQEEKRLAETYKYQLEMLLDLVKKLGFKSIYILIDRPDETEQTGNNPEATYRLIRPLIKDLELLGLRGYGFKFFLWDQVEPYYREDARPDRVSQYKLNWKRNSLKTVLSSRMKVFSGNRLSCFQELVDPSINKDVDEIICLMSNGSPRNMIRICERIFAVQAETNSESTVISSSSIDKGILEFSEMLFRETYGDVYLRDIQRVGRELFTTNYIANDVLKISGQGARNKITGWSDVGLVSQIGTVTVPPARRPVNFYCVIDPIAVRLIHRTIPLDQFLNDRWVPCKCCATDNLINIELYPVDNDAVCRDCGRVLL